MKKLILLFIMQILTTSYIYGCCAEQVYRLFPIGEIDNKVVFIEFNLHRNCDMDGKTKGELTFWTKGFVNLVSTSGDSLAFLQTIDTIDIIDCQCSYENYYQKTIIESVMSESYEKAFAIAREYKGFLTIEPQKIIFNDTLNTKISEEPTDSAFTYIVNYNNLVTIDLENEGFMSCPPDKVSEARYYKTENYSILIVRMRCRLIDNQAIMYNSERFKNVKTAFWKEQAQWHGIAKDYYIVKAANR